MRVVKPIWIRHDESNKDGKILSIFSIDISPDGKKVATGGQGNDCGRVAIWNMAPIRSTDAEQSKLVPKLLCAIDSHLQCVNAVRWSSSGSYLASAGDDQLIMIWALSGRHSGPGPAESYRLVSTLRSHSGDILDLSWSHCGQWLASSSVDNMIVIWNAHRWPEIVTTLRGHTGLVKGVSFDPIGKYLASQSDDKSLRVWRVSDWTEEVVISEPFEQCGGTTHVLRLSWSPDGQFLVSAQAMNNCGSVAKIIDRQDWRADKDFVGHRKAIPVVRFNPNIFKFQSAAASKGSKGNKANSSNKDNKENKEAKLKRQSVLAVGSRDRSISIWATARGSRPLMVCKDLFDNSILDFSWSRNGYELMACSSDGTVAFIEFTEKELGPKCSENEKCQYLQQLYGKNLGNNSKSALMSNLIEDLDIMLLQKGQQKEEEEAEEELGSSAANSSNNNNNDNDNSTANHRPTTSSSTTTTTNGAVAAVDNLISTTNRPLLEKPTPAEMLSNNSNSSKGAIGGGLRLAKGPLDKQIEIRSADGRRRIIPLFIPPLNDALGADEQLNQGGGGPASAGIAASASTAASLNTMSFSSSSEAKSKIVIETRDESNPPLEYMTYVTSDQVLLNGLSKTKTTTATPSMNGNCLPGKQANNVCHSNNDTNDSSEFRPKSPVPTTSSAALTNGTMVNGGNKVTSNNTSQVRPESSNDSSSSDIIIRRHKGAKRKISIENDQPPEQMMQQQQQQQQLPTIPVKRKPGRPPGSGPNQQASKQQQQQQFTSAVEAAPMNRLPEANGALPNGPKSIISHEGDLMMRTAAVSSSVSSKPTSSIATTNNRLTSNTTSTSSSNTFSRRHNYFPALKLNFQQSSKISTKLFTCSETSKVYTAEVERPLVSSPVCKLTVVVDEERPLWSVLLSSTICALTANQTLLVAACDDNSLSAFNTATGSRTLLSLIVESPVARMVIANRSHLLVITSNAKLWLWDLLSPPKVLLKGESLLPLLIHPKTGEQLAILSASVAASGQPVVAVANGRTYAYQTELSSWLLIADVSNPLNACTDLKPSSLTGVRGALPVAKMPSRSLQNFFSSNAPTAQHGLISFIEQQLETAKVLANGKDYRFWLGSLVQNLVSQHSSGFNTENIELRLRELCNFLIGGQFPRSAAAAGGALSTTSVSCFSTPLPARNRTATSMVGGGTSSNKVLGISKHELLREVLSILASNLCLQRLYLEYKEQLDSFSSFSMNIASTSTLFHSTAYQLAATTPKAGAVTVDTAGDQNRAD